MLIGAYFIFIDKKDGNNEYEEYYKKLVERGNFSDSFDGVNVYVEEIVQTDNKYTYIITLDGVSEKKEDVKVLVLDEKCKKDEVEYFPSFGIMDNKGYSLVKDGEEDNENKMIKGINLTVVDKNKIDCFLIYFSSNGGEQFVRVSVE